jgi:hypothetical protein
VSDNLGRIIIYNTEQGGKIEVKLEENTVWLNQNQISELFNVGKSTINYHINNILKEEELSKNSVVRIFRITAEDGKNYNVYYYNLDMIIAIGFRVKSNVATIFRKWANETLKEYMIKGFAINDDILKQSGGGRYFKELLSRIRDIRSSERVFWRQVLDIFATSSDYDPRSEISINFFKTVQNKLHYAVHGHTAAEIIKERADFNKDFMGLTSFGGNYPIYEDVVIAKNYLDDKELEMLNRIVSLYLDFAELQALEENVMTMNDWVNQLDYFLKMSRKDILEGKGLVSHQEALEHAKEEYIKFKNRLLTEPTDVERRYLDNINVLLSYTKKKGE